LNPPLLLLLAQDSRCCMHVWMTICFHGPSTLAQMVHCCPTIRRPTSPIHLHC
jgi:hypothetical protein